MQEAFMETTRIDRWTRRMFGLAVGGATASLFGLADAATKQRGNGERGGGRERQNDKVKVEKKKKLKRGPAGPAGPPGPTGPVPTVRVTRIVDGALSAPLEATAGSFASSVAECGPGKVVSCGFLVNATAEQLVNVVVIGARVIDGIQENLSACEAALQRAAGAGSTAGAKISAIATCLD
jgi:hypothetical protein